MLFLSIGSFLKNIYRENVDHAYAVNHLSMSIPSIEDLKLVRWTNLIFQETEARLSIVILDQQQMGKSNAICQGEMKILKYTTISKHEISRMSLEKVTFEKLCMMALAVIL